MGKLLLWNSTYGSKNSRMQRLETALHGPRGTRLEKRNRPAARRKARCFRLRPSARPPGKIRSRRSGMEQIPGYHILEKIGEGGMATVYKGVQFSLKRPVAIKVLQKKMVEQSSVLDRFKRESLIIARLNHPNIIHIIDRGITSEGMPYFIMEYVEGMDLSAAVNTGSPGLNRKLDIITQICKALSYAHKNGVIHRDIKPSNILIDLEGNVHVLDFGIAQFYDDEDPEFQHTCTGTIMGTPDYMSPEQRSSTGYVTALSDLYSLGVVMYEMFTGVKPVGRFKLPREFSPGLPESVQEVIISCLEAEPADRPDSADEIKDQLLRVLSGAHLKKEQKTRASRDLSDIKEKFALLDVIKEGPLGSVHLYEDRVNDTLMVIKKQPKNRSGYLEAKLLASLRHDHIVDILGASKNKSAFIVVMEYLTGGSLKDRMVKPYETEVFLTLARQICEGLIFAHRNGIIHGNLRPSNILFSDTGRAKISDFGLDEHYVPPKGKVNWYNPTNEPKSVQADILATGVIFLQMLTGTDPEWIDDVVALPPVFDDLPIELQGILIRMFSAKKKNRYKDLNDVVSDLDSFASAGKEPEIPSAAPTVLEEVPPQETAVNPAPKISSPAPFRKLFWLLLLMLLLFAAFFYLTYTGQIYGYVDILNNAWKDAATYLEKLMGKP